MGSGLERLGQVVARGMFHHMRSVLPELVSHCDHAFEAV
jgi:hypothetical protein